MKHYRTTYSQLGMRFWADCICGFRASATAVTMDQLTQARDSVILAVDNHVIAENSRERATISVTISEVRGTENGR